jgi:hypothetical protein
VVQDISKKDRPFVKADLSEPNIVGNPFPNASDPESNTVFDPPKYSGPKSETPLSSLLPCPHDVSRIAIQNKNVYLSSSK